MRSADVSAIVGISAGHFNPSVALATSKGDILFLEEERLSREKRAPFQFPSRALRHVISEFKLAPTQIEAITIGWNTHRYDCDEVADHYKQIVQNHSIDQRTSRWFAENNKKYRTPIVTEYLQNHFMKALHSNYSPPIVSYGHHFSHAVGAAHYSGFNRSLVLVIDGSAEVEATSIWLFSDNHISLLHRELIPNSLGWLYAAITEYLGFRVYDGEFKVMGLASYGLPNPQILKKFDRIIRQNGYRYSIDPSYIFYGDHRYSERFTDKLVDLFENPPRRPEENLRQWHADIAWGVQHAIEESAVALVRHFAEIHQVRHVCLTGGVAHNVKLNGELLRCSWIDDVFGDPFAGDAGVALSSCLHYASKRFSHARERLSSAIFTTPMDLIRIDAAVDGGPWHRETPDDLEEAVADLLAAGEFVAWCQGGMESGPRALGNRSLLADPRHVANKAKLNLAKGRELWRPFAPSLTADLFYQHYEASRSDEFMTAVRYAEPELAAQIPAVVHHDGTFRPQVVTAESHPQFHKLLKAFGARSGVEALINTSLNLHGEPIVESARDAVNAFAAMQISYMAVGPYLLKKYW